MASNLIVLFNGEESQFGLQMLDRAKLYGKRKRLNLDPAGAACTRAELTEDGQFLVRSGMTAQGYFDESLNWVPRGDLIGINGKGEPVEKVPSTLGVPQPLVGPSHQAIQESPTEQVWAKSSQWESKLKKANSLRFLSLIIDFQVFNCSPKNFENAFSTRSLSGHTVHLSCPF